MNPRCLPGAFLISLPQAWWQGLNGKWAKHVGYLPAQVAPEFRFSPPWKAQKLESAVGGPIFFCLVLPVA